MTLHLRAIRYGFFAPYFPSLFVLWENIIRAKAKGQKKYIAFGMDFHFYLLWSLLAMKDKMIK
jgi:hypothetical protein